MSKTSPTSAVVLFSGGQDSTTCLLWAVREFEKVFPLVVDYGQRHAVEIECARDICQNLGLQLTEVKSDEIRTFSDDALTHPEKVIEKGDERPNTFVPGRNLSFLLTAARFAYFVGADAVVAGMCQTDYSGYPDCREEFVRAAETAIHLAFDRRIPILTPLMFLTKAQTWQLADELGGLELVVNRTHTCYHGVRDAAHDWGYGCGHCPACELRKKGWNEYVCDYRSKAPQKTYSPTNKR